MQHTQQLFLEALKAALKNEQVEWNNKLEAQECFEHVWLHMIPLRRGIMWCYAKVIR